MLPFFRRKNSPNGHSQEPERPTPDQDVAIAAQALLSGDLPHAVAHIAGALAGDATQRDSLDLADQVFARAKSPLDLVPLGERNYVGTVALRAYFLAKSGDLAQALPMLFQAALSHPAAGYLAWADRWLSNSAGQDVLQDGTEKWLVSQLMQHLPRAPRAHRERDWGIVPLLLQTIQRTQAPDTLYSFMAVALLRRLDIPDTALSIAQDAYAKSPDYYSANAMASAYRSANRPQDAIGAYEEALRYQPDGISVMLDIADLYTEIGRMTDAIAWYGKVVAREPEHEWALPSLYAARYTASGEKGWQDKLDAFAEAHPQNERARILSDQFHPYFGGRLPEPPDAVINVMRQFMHSAEGKANPAKPASINISISALEAPSAILAANLEIKRYSPGGVVGITIDEIQQPDPRLPRVPVDLQLWQYDGAYASPAVPPPSPAVMDVVEFVAGQPYNMKIWLDLAREAASRLTPDDAEGIAATMVHPSSVPEGIRAWTWLQRIQFAAALVLSQLDTGWTGSIRRRALIDLANGPLDWSVGAAAVALAAIAKTENEARAEVTQLYRDILKNTPTSGYTCYVEPVLVSYLAVPEISPGERERLESLLAQLQQANTMQTPGESGGASRPPDEDDEPGYAPGDE